MNGTIDLDRIQLPATSAAEAMLAMWRVRGIDFLFANAGTDFPSLIEAYARESDAGLDLPEPITVPHENAAVSMAHGHYLGSGRMQAVMVHVSVGLANSLCALLNAAREQVPIFFCAGRTPLSESGHLASRDVSIHWGQEMYDQAAMLREMVKWDYELRDAAQLEAVIDRAMALAMSDPGGPIYLGLPREVLAEGIPGFSCHRSNRIGTARATGVDQVAIKAAAKVLAEAERPVIVTSRAGRETAAVAALSAFARDAAIPVIEYRANYMNLPSGHPMHGGFDFTADFADVDAILVIDTPAPWLPSRHQVPARAPVIQMGADPLSTDIPIRSFSADIAIVARPSAALPELAAAFEEAACGQRDRIEARRARLTARHQEGAAARRSAFSEAPPTMTAAWASHCLDRIKDEHTVVFNELGCVRPAMTFTQPGTFFGPSNAGGLGWGLPASLGYKLACPDRTVVCCLGDGSHMFANPVACHQVAVARGIATLTMVFNNRRWQAVKTATASVYPDGAALNSAQVPMTSLEPSPDFAHVMRACGGHGRTISEPDELPAALEEALAQVLAGRPALLNVLCD